MSGGSFNYLCHKEASEILDQGHEHSDLEAMAQRLSGLGYAQDAARETEELLLIVRQIETRIHARVRRLSEVWRAVEWWDSGDTGEDGLKEALSKYRESGAQ